MVQRGDPREAPGRALEPRRRVSVSFDAADYEELQRIAAAKRVSVAWVVRDAVAAYIFQRGPLFRPPPRSRPTRKDPE